MAFIETARLRVLLVFVDPRNGLVVSSKLPAFEIEELSYFVKIEEGVVTAENFSHLVQSGTLRTTYVDSLLRLLKEHFGPTFFTNHTWPDGIRNDFSGQLHRTMAHLTDAQHRTTGHTQLYVPHEGPAMDCTEAAKNKELVQRLEGVDKHTHTQSQAKLLKPANSCVSLCGVASVSLYSCGAGCVIHWTRQIKEVLNAQEALEQADTAGPLEEIEFWTMRCEDLSGLTTQLDQPGVLRVCHILDRAKSSYLKQFRKLARQIRVRT